MNQITATKQYRNSFTQYARFRTREVDIGGVPMGGDNPIRVQSMTTANTRDTEASVEEAIRIIEAGTDYVRLTAPSKKDAENLQNIKDEIRRRGYQTPLIADIHFTPNAAEIAAQIVEKVRVNPGNYADKKRFQVFELSDDEYNAELERIREKFAPLARLCKEQGTAMRIGTNHGSLSDRIMNRFGDTPMGMVESALEFVRICEEEDFHDIVLSMKASNPQVMVQAYRLLVHQMMQENMNYPIHLGVTEAGEGEDGRLKSAMGMGTLLEDGIGDTVRVSLTEEPEKEVPVCQTLVNRYDQRPSHEPIPPIDEPPFDPFNTQKRSSTEVANMGSNNVPVVVTDLSQKTLKFEEDLAAGGYLFNRPAGKWKVQETAGDYVYVGHQHVEFPLPEELNIVQDYDAWLSSSQERNHYPLIDAERFIEAEHLSPTLNFVEVTLDDLTPSFLASIQDNTTIALVAKTDNANAMAELRRLFFELELHDIHHPVIVKRNYNGLDEDQLLLYGATDIGGLLIDGFGDGVMLQAPERNTEWLNAVAFGILQSSRMRIFRTDFISCPSCGRTQFDLQETTAKVRERTDHLKGVKIAIMGCIVNGPGEMADADYGYVGSGKGKVTLYRGKEIVKQGVDASVAVDELIELIKEDGLWREREEN
ncbi:MAG: 4-hydroxy-3-methylbut-2-en-1-yl diphosphate synthase [Bacteroidetes bacterium SW_11_45_7]|nr:MAG: 4-hydroxy-3-methylbut-2-en-1-yl diphosphate synthase [Bacteroidetes bacterium SW_11_45_7]